MVTLISPAQARAGKESALGGFKDGGGKGKLEGPGLGGGALQKFAAILEPAPGPRQKTIKIMGGAGGAHGLGTEQPGGVFRFDEVGLLHGFQKRTGIKTAEAFFRRAARGH